MTAAGVIRTARTDAREHPRVEHVVQADTVDAPSVPQPARATPRDLTSPRQLVDGVATGLILHLGESATVDTSRGVFLDHTWRMHPDICAFTTEQFYEGRLRARPELRRQTVVGPGPLAGYGLRFIPVAHAGNTNASAEEAECVAALISELLDAEATWVDRQGVQERLTPDDVLVVAPTTRT